jgi:hypothetical protein
MTSVSELRASLEKHNDTFENLLKLIPAKYYLPKEPSDEVGLALGLGLLTMTVLLGPFKIHETQQEA